MQISRRQMLSGASAATATAFAGAALAEWKPAEAYPDPAIPNIDPSFAKNWLYNAAPERLATGFRWAEGPVWFGDFDCLLWSDAALDRIALGRGNGIGQRLPQTRQQAEQSHSRPAGPPADL